MSGRHCWSNPLTLAGAGRCGSSSVLASLCVSVAWLAADPLATLSSVWWSLTVCKVEEGAAPSPSSKSNSSVLDIFAEKNLKLVFAIMFVHVLLYQLASNNFLKPR